MSISTEPVSAPQAKENGHESNEPVDDGSAAATKTPPKTSLDTSSTNHSVDPTADFAGDLETDNTLPTEALLRKIEDYQVLDKDGKARPFKSLYTGPNVTRRVLVIFIRHFFCGVSWLCSLLFFSQIGYSQIGYCMLTSPFVFRIAKNTFEPCQSPSIAMPCFNYLFQLSLS